MIFLKIVGENVGGKVGKQGSWLLKNDWKGGKVWEHVD